MARRVAARIWRLVVAALGAGAKAGLWLIRRSILRVPGATVKLLRWIAARQGAAR